MAHGYPDWGHGKAVTVYPLVTDLAELAARLGSPVTYDRRGNVIWMDDFTHGKAAWWPLTDGDGAAVALETANPQRGPYCCKLTGGSDKERNALIYRDIRASALGAYGLELSVRFATYWDYFALIMARRDGTTKYTSEIRLSYADSELQVVDSDGTATKVADLSGRDLQIGRYHALKFVVNFSTNAYVRLLFDGNSYDISAYSVQQASDSNPDSFYIAVSHYSRSGSNDHCNVDGVIFTQNEP